MERTTRFTMLLHLPRMPGHGQQQPIKNGPALAGHGATAVRDAIAASITTLPKQLRKSLTWDQDAEMAQHTQLRTDASLAIYFCDPQSPWQRGANENTNGLLRQYFPKGTNLSLNLGSDFPASPPQWFFGLSNCIGASRLAAGGSHRSARAPVAMSPRFGSGRPRRPSQHTISTSAQASVAYLGQYRQPVLGAFAAFAEPYPQHLFTGRPRPLQPPHTLVG